MAKGWRIAIYILSVFLLLLCVGEAPETSCFFRATPGSFCLTGAGAAQQHANLGNYKSVSDKIKLKTKIRIKYRERYCYYDLAALPGTPVTFFRNRNCSYTYCDSGIIFSFLFTAELRGPPSRMACLANWSTPTVCA